METETGRLIRLERKVDELRDQIRWRGSWAMSELDWSDEACRRALTEKDVADARRNWERICKLEHELLLRRKLEKLRERNAELVVVIEGLVWQFAYSNPDGSIHHGGLSALEDAFEALGWESPYMGKEDAGDE